MGHISIGSHFHMTPAYLITGRPPTQSEPGPERYMIAHGKMHEITHGSVTANQNVA